MDIEPLKILAFDPALANMGWTLVSFDPNVIHEEPIPSWMTDKIGIHTYKCFQRIDGGTFSTNNKISINARMIHQIDEVHLLCAIHKPELIAMESQLEVGSARCTWGVAIQFGIVFPYFCTNLRQVRLARCPDDRWSNGERQETTEVFSHIDHVPNYGVALKPPQLQSVAHHEGQTKSRVVKERYHEISGDTRKNITDHEADAYFVAVHSGRFWATCLERCWGTEFLTKKEQKTFFAPETGMVHRRDESWWCNLDT
jgi:Holliday junction resolvasome RuvABC endonuclease subunit